MTKLPYVADDRGSSELELELRSDVHWSLVYPHEKDSILRRLVCSIEWWDHLDCIFHARIWRVDVRSIQSKIMRKICSHKFEDVRNTIMIRLL